MRRSQAIFRDSPKITVSKAPCAIGTR
jgi:hypothetical protein